ncbi:hypothetical protein B4135_3442 [Caldibacillus debilis]|uniref:Uncharacterized protein n=1 Tax=Caldibacillus debilis TaxID=301148 RepID=A0A150LE67_9BACI|nr:hypothetical protein B4135_3442 [Caldibacillus debilis]
MPPAPHYFRASSRGCLFRPVFSDDPVGTGPDPHLNGALSPPPEGVPKKQKGRETSPVTEKGSAKPPNLFPYEQRGWEKFPRSNKGV